MPSSDMQPPQHSLQVGDEMGEGGEEDEGQCGGLGWYMIPRATLRKPHTCKRSASVIEQPWRDKTYIPERPGSQVDVHHSPYIIQPTRLEEDYKVELCRQDTEPTESKTPGSRLALQDNSSNSSTTTLSASRVRDWLHSSPPSSNTSTQSGSSGSLLLTAANIAGLRLESTSSQVARGKDVDTVSLASSTHFTMVGGYGPARCKQVKRSICAKHSVSVLVITTCSLFLLGLTAAVYYIDMRTKAVKYYS